MNDREKLIELIEKWNKDEFCVSYASYELADYFIENGVVIQKQGTWSLRYGFKEGTSFEVYYIECSKCGRQVEIPDEDATNWEKIESDYPYCHCGAYMEKEVK